MTVDVIDRERRGCGWLPPATRTGVLQLPLGKCPEPLEYDVCPGWLITLPAVLEAARAYGWRNHLRDLYEGKPITAPLMDAIDVFSYEVETVKAAVMKEASSGR